MDRCEAFVNISRELFTPLDRSRDRFKFKSASLGERKPLKGLARNDSSRFDNSVSTTYNYIFNVSQPLVIEVCSVSIFFDEKKIAKLRCRIFLLSSMNPSRPRVLPFIVESITLVRINSSRVILAVRVPQRTVLL